MNDVEHERERQRSFQVAIDIASARYEESRLNLITGYRQAVAEAQHRQGLLTLMARQVEFIKSHLAVVEGELERHFNHS